MPGGADGLVISSTSGAISHDSFISPFFWVRGVNDSLGRAGAPCGGASAGYLVVALQGVNRVTLELATLGMLGPWGLPLMPNL